MMPLFRKLLPILAIVLCLGTVAIAPTFLVSAESGASRTTFTLWQIPTVTTEQNLSYVISTATGDVIVIDGGRPEDHVPLLKLFNDKGIDHVDAWFITHPHGDHCGALIAILAQPDHIRIDRIYDSIPTTAWVTALQHTKGSGVDVAIVAVFNLFNYTLEKSGVPVTNLRVGDLKIGGLTFQVLRVWNPDIKVNAFNNSCMVMRVTDGANSILFLADLSNEAGKEILNESVTPGIVARLQSDYVQISHHGLNGVPWGFYAKVQPKYALWPAPMKWYDPPSGAPAISSDTRQVKLQMDMLGIGEDKRFVSGRDGLTEFRFTIPPSQPGVVYMEHPHDR